MKLLSTILICMFFIACIGCQTSVYTLTNEENSLPPTSFEQVQITTENKISRPYKELGYVFAFSGSLEDAVENLKKQSGEFGGDVVLNFEVTVIRQFIYILFIPIPIDSHFASGMVVKTL